SSQDELNRALQLRSAGEGNGATQGHPNPTNPDSSDQGSKQALNQGPNQASSAAGIDQAESEPASDTGTPESEPEQGRVRGKGRFQRRIDKLTRERTQALELAGQERQARLRLEAQLVPRRGTGAPQQGHAGEADPKPSEEQFETWEDYTEGLTRWAARQE